MTIPKNSSVGDVVSQVFNLLSVIGMVIGGFGVFQDMTIAKEIAEQFPLIVDQSGKTAEQVIQVSGEVVVQTKALIREVKDGTDAMLLTGSAVIGTLTNRFTKLFALFR